MDGVGDVKEKTKDGVMDIDMVLSPVDRVVTQHGFAKTDVPLIERLGHGECRGETYLSTEQLAATIRAGETPRYIPLHPASNTHHQFKQSSQAGEAALADMSANVTSRLDNRLRKGQCHLYYTFHAIHRFYMS